METKIFGYFSSFLYFFREHKMHRSIMMSNMLCGKGRGGLNREKDLSKVVLVGPMGWQVGLLDTLM